MILRIFTFCFTYLSVFFLLIPAGVAGEDAGSKTGASYFLSMTENSLLPERNSAYVGTRVYVLSDPEAWLEVATETSPLQWFDELVMDLPILGNHDPDYASVINPETSFKEGMVMSCDAFLANIDDALVSGPDPSTPFVETADVFGNTGSFNCGTENAYPSPILSTEQSNGFGTAFCPAPTPMILRGTDESYQVVVGGNFTVPSQGGAEIEGRAAIGGNLDVNRIFGLGESGGGTFVVSEPGEYLQVGGNVTGTGPINTGTNTATGPGQNTALIGGTNAVTINSATVQQGATLTFDIAQQLAEMSNASMGMSIATPTGSFAGGVLTGTNAALEIFNITAADVSSSVLTFADIAPGATIVVNVSGAGAINFAGSRNGRVNDPQSGSSDPDALVYNVVWNFYETTGVVTVNPNVTSGIHGLVLIPNGNLTLNTNLNGRLFVGGDVTFSSPTAFGPEIHNYPFTGDLSSFCGVPGMCDVTAIAFAIQASCDSDGNIASDGYLQISATDGLSYEVIDDGNSVIVARTTLVGEAFPLQILTGLANPMADQDYTIRIYEEDVSGASDCFINEVVTLRVQDCAVGCNCEEFVYLNEPSTDGAVHKFLVNGDGSFSEVFSASGGAWFDNAVQMEGLTSPHGLAIDPNGFVYIGETAGNGNQIRKFTCEGEILPESEFGITTLGQFNLASIGNYMYSNTPGGPFSINRYDFCDDALFPDIANGENSANPPGGISFCTTDSDGNAISISPASDWGLYVNRETEEFYATQGFFTGPGSVNYVWRFTADDFDGTDCIEPLDMGPDFPSEMTSIQGITLDGDGNIYIVIKRDDRPVPPSPLSNSSYIMKFGLNVAGDAYELLAQSTADNASDGTGHHLATGIIYSETTNRIYVSTESLFDPCVAEFDTDLNYVGSTVPAPGGSDFGKGIAITKECCPTNNNQLVEIVACNADATRPILLNEEFPCDGTVCEAQWTPLDPASTAVYDPCNQSIIVGTTAGCYSFTRSSDGTGLNAQCGAFVQTLTFVVSEVEAAIVAGDQEICAGEDPDPFTVTSTATGSGALTYEWEVSTTSATAGFTPIPGANTATYDPTPADITASTVYFRQLAFVEGCVDGSCADTSNSVVIITLVDCPILCDLTITAAPEACDLTDNSYEIVVTATYENAPTGDISITVDGGTAMTFTPDGTSPDMFTISGLQSNGAMGIVVNAEFVNDTDCNATTTYDAPAQCFVPVEPPTPCVSGPGVVGGTVFQDFNNDGADADPAEPGQEGILVSVFDCDGVEVCQTTTAADGGWSCSGLTDGEEYRVEFTFPASLDYLQPSAHGTDNGTDVQFVTPATCDVNFGVVDPALYCQTNPLMATPCYISGNPLGGGSSAAGDVFISFRYNNSGRGASCCGLPVNAPVPQKDADAVELGSTWGVAYQRQEQRLYTSAFVKRHVGIGPLGEGGIYVLDYAADPANPTIINWLDVNTVGINTGTVGTGATPAARNTSRGLSNNAGTANPSGDPTAFDAVGKVGLGDIDITSDESTLWVINLNDQTLNSIEIDSDDNIATPPTASDVSTFPIPNPCGIGTQRPFAVKAYQGQVYVGVVCENALEAYIYRFDGTAFSPVLVNGVPTIDLSYTKGFASINCPSQTGWFTWASTPVSPANCSNSNPANVLYAYPTPMLSDIEFDLDGSMILAFMDRSGHQFGAGNTQFDGTGFENYHGAGDILRVCNVSGAFVMQGSAGCTNNVNNNQGPNGGEYYGQDQYNETTAGIGSRGVIHAETVTGGLALLPGSGEVAVVSYDPVNTLFVSGGINWFNNTTGVARNPGYMVYIGQDADGFNSGEGTQGKANGLGDIELLCDQLPIEIGNYVWYDTDMDGVQDACEDPVMNLPVTLIDKATGNVIAVTTTDATTGQYYFTETGDGLEHDTEYLIVFGYDGNTPANSVVSSGGIFDISGMLYELTDADASTQGATDLNDSDATLMDMAGLTQFPMINYTTADSTDHSLDVGLTPVISFDLALTKVINTTATSGPFAPGDNVTFTIEVFNQGNVDATDVIVTDYVPTGMIFNAGDNTDFSGATPTATIASLPAGTSTTVDITLQIDPATLASEIVNYAEITSFDDDGDPGTPPPTDEDSTPGDNQGTDETGTDNENDDEFPGTPGTVDRPDDADDYDPAPVMVTQPPCLISITNVDVVCTNGTDFMVSFDVEWDNANALTDMIEVTVDGDAQTFTPTMTMDVMSFGPVSLNGPAYDILLEANFLANTACSATSSVNLIACTPDCVDGPGTVGGNVFNDFNNDGADAGAGEVGQENVLVEVYDCDGMLVCSTYTNADGNWSCAGLNDAEEYRVEFSTPLQPYLQPSFAGTDNGTNTQFVTAPSCEVDYGVVNPADVCSEPLIVAPCYIGGTAASQGNGDVLVDFNYDGTGSIRTIATGSQIGATWGVAYAGKSQTLYVSEVVRRHSGTASTNQNVIYTIDYSSGTPSAPVPFITLAGVGGITRDLPGVQSTDAAAFTAAGTSGIGDIDLSSDGQTLYVTNLSESRVDIVDIATATVTGSITYPAVGGCTLRPWALKVQDGNVYAGAVCEDALRAYVFQANGNQFEIVDLNTADPGEDFFDLSYARESVWALNPTFIGAGDCNADELIPTATQWNTWINTFPAAICVSPFGDADDYIIYPQAILSDIEFDTDGSIILGFLDRTGLQGGFQQPDPNGNGQFVTIAGGDIIRICATGTGFAPEGTAGCAQNDTGDDVGYAPSGSNTNADNALLDDGAEFYNGDDWLNGSGEGEHYENALGGLVMLPRSGEVATSVYDPITGAFNAGGVRWLSNSTGESLRALQLYQNGDPATFAKAAGIGDLELVCDPLPIQIGNYVWLDEDEDGIQDACEDPVEGLPVTLYTKDEDGTLTQVATTTTGPNGEYYFTGDGTTGETWENSGESILNDTTYLIVFGNTPESDTSFVYDNTEYGVTQDSTGEGNNPGLNDSDATFQTSPLGNLPSICYNTADSTDHTLDVGLVPLAVFDLALIKTLDLNTNPGPFSPGSTVDFNITVYNQGDTDATDVEVKDYIPEGLSLAPASAPNWTVSVDTAILTTPFSLAAGEDSVLNISFVIDVDFMSDTLTNRAEISNFDDDNDPNTDPPVDEDSTPDDNGDDPAEVNTPDEIDDDGDGTPGTEDDPNDEDDYDWEGIPVLQSFDLNLVKRVDTITTPGPFTYGSTVAYTIEVRNQGSLDATDVEVADYVPDGLTLVPDANWMLDVDTARTTATYAIAAGDTLQLAISFTIDLDFAEDNIVNTAEITDAMNALGRPDEDSNPGDNGGDDPEFDTDDEDNDDGPNGNGNPDDPADSDDFDLARLSIETVSLGSTVFLDNNNDGFQNGVDTGIANVTVQLFDAATEMEVFTDASGTRVLTAGEAAPTLTDADGNYLFDNLVPGDYYVVLPTAPATAPLSSNNTGIAFTETDPDDNLDNDDEGVQAGGSGTSVSSDTITLALGDEPEDGAAAGAETGQGAMQDNAFDSNGNMTLDFGFFAPVSVGDTAFVDLDGDGLQTLGEPGIGGVTVALLDSNGDTVMIDADGMMITGVTTTTPDGSYLFDNLPPGVYSVSFDISTADDAEFYAFTTPNAGDDADDSDNSITLSDSTAQSDPTPFLNSGEQDLTLDVGVVCALEVTVAEPFTICATQTIDLTTDVTITPDTSATFGATWTTPDGTGDFLDAAGNVLTAPFGYDTAITYRPAAADALRGSVTLILTTDDPAGPCEPVSDSVTIEVLKVDCGQFMWDGSND